MLKYEDFINENILSQLLLESKIVFSNKFKNLISKMRDNKIAKELLAIVGDDHDIRYNYIDITDTKDSVSFIPDAKAQEIKGDKKVETFKVINDSRYLTHSPRNNRIFELLGYDRENREVWSPSIGTVGIILKETKSPISDKIYVLFQEYDSETPRTSVINKIGLEPYDNEPKEVWTSSRNNMKVGRLVRAILKSADIDFTDKDIEDFTNQYKATFDFSMDALKQFDIVKGRDISYWYDEDNYESGGGTLNNSCMANVNSDYFDIYCYNSQVSMVILYSEDGRIVDNKYVSDKIRGRAILWDATLDGQKITFMDRIYTTHDSDVELFKQFAEKNDWWYKVSQSMDQWDQITNGSERKLGRIIVNADETKFDYYPYMDTMSYLNTDEDVITNDSDYDGLDRELRSTCGDYDSL